MKKMSRGEKPVYNQGEMSPKYDLAGVKGVRGKYYQAMQEAFTITVHKKDGTVVVKEVKPKGMVLLEPEIRKYFPNSKSVNAALRSMIAAAPLKYTRKARETQAKYRARRTASTKKTNR